MLVRIAPICLAAALVILANGCVCTQPSLCGDAAVPESCGVAGCGSCAGASAACGSRYLADCATRALTCGSGCGEVYWGEWANDPPACKDPCDDCGNWTGEAYGAPHCKPLQGIRHLWGYRYAPAGCDVAYDSYPTDTTEFIEVEETEQQLVPPKPEPEPTPAKNASTGRRVRHATFNRPVHW